MRKWRFTGLNSGWLISADEGPELLNRLWHWIGKAEWDLASHTPSLRRYKYIISTRILLVIAGQTM